jgi:hypothetical protein
VSARDSYDYAIVRVVPWVDRGECINVGVILHCKERRFLAARIELDTQRLEALAPGVDVELLREHLDAIPRVCEGGDAAGPIGRLSQAERFHWLTSPRSTMVQVSPAHSGLCDDPAGTLEHLMTTMVRVSRREAKKGDGE